MIFFYQNKNLTQPDISMMYREDYLLVKVGICADTTHWFGLALSDDGQEEGAPCRAGGEDCGACEKCAVRKGCGTSEKCAVREGCGTSEKCAVPEGCGTCGKCTVSEDGTAVGEHMGRRTKFFFLRKKFAGHRRTGHRNRRVKNTMDIVANACDVNDKRVQEAGSAAVLKSMLSLSNEIYNRIQQLDHSFEVKCVYDNGAECLMPSVNQMRSNIAKLWSEVWKVDCIANFTDFRWVQPLLVNTAPMDYVLLGTAECVQQVLQQCALKMRTLRWIPDRDEKGVWNPEEIQEITEEFLEEYGLIIILQDNPTDSFGRLQPEQELCVLDFSGADKLPFSSLKKGSIWIDFTSSGEKRKRLTQCSPGTLYFSMKQYWEECKRRECKIPCEIPTFS